MLENLNQLIDNNIFYFLGLIMILLTAFIMTKQIFILDNIKTYSVQSFCIFLLNLALLRDHFNIHLLLSACIILIFKVIILPFFLRKTVKKLHIDDQFENLVNIQILFVVLGLLTGLCFFVFPNKDLTTLNPVLYHTLPISAALVLNGLLLMINRAKTISQIMGFLVMENGISLLILFSAKSLPMILEVALGIDLLIGVLIMGIFSNKIKSNFEDLEISLEKDLREGKL